ncbi:M4 family metallopeptidase [Granulicella arctica]|uniref:M4 family metallopeptidase n=1 Tax=Granulicella arctica TaxID=940613 RepID=UPI0021DFBD2F|nr:M4 family metallopeptidase [Granulicella arctica]
MCSSNRRRSIYCILPPNILINVAKRGTQEQRDAVLETLSVDQSLRASRTQFALLGGNKVAHESITATPPQKQRTIYDTNHTQTLPGTMVRSEGQAAVADVSVNQAYDGLGNTFDFYYKSYQRNSIDNAGLRLNATVHYGSKYDNAFWNGQEMIFGDGDGVLFNSFTGSVDVIGHELTHGVTGSEANLIYLGQSGALNESISDVFGSCVKQFVLNQTADQADWLIGAGLLAKSIQGVALRSMKAPGTAYDDPMLGKDDQPADMAHYVHTASDSGGVHTNSGIPNRAFFLAASAIGGFSWLKAGQVWYDTLTDPRLKPQANFASFANLTVLNAGRLYGSTSPEKKAVSDAWHTVGVLKQPLSIVNLPLNPTQRGETTPSDGAQQPGR